MRRHTILEALCASKGEYISGEHLSQTLGITAPPSGKAWTPCAGKDMKSNPEPA